MTSPAPNAPSLPNPLDEDALKGKASGLTQAEVDKKHQAGESNQVDNATSRPISAILRANVFTLFNGILVTCAVAVLAVGDWRDAVFGIVLVLNLAIGVLSELRSKHALDSLAVLVAPTSTVLRDGKWSDVDNAELVTSDVIKVKLGDQIPADGQVLTSEGMEVDESALTGESRSVRKQKGDSLMSGTAVVAGSGQMLVEVIGGDAWAQKITKEVRRFSKVHSEIQDAINKVLRWITMALPFIVALLLWSQLRSGNHDWRTAIIFTVAGVVGMIPQGLVLLTSMNFGLAAAILARKGVLMQELPAVEVLARVNVLCLDKTGTLTTGDIRGREFVSSPKGDEDPTARSVLAAMVSDQANATAKAVAGLLKDTKPLDSKPTTTLPFNSARKWSAMVVPAQNGTITWVMGAPEILLDDEDAASQWARDAVSNAGQAGRRSVCLSSTTAPLEDEKLPENLQPALVAILEEDVRPDAKETLEYFEQQGVTIKIISGDAPKTVATIAGTVGLKHPDGGDPVAVDARKLPEIGTPEFVDAARSTDVFGRVTPEQKRGLVHALQKDGHTVAMTGDGVNDALALKDADLGIAMGNAAPATKSVSRLVLVDGKFSDLPGVVAEGRRIIANMERVSSLFLSKTTYAMLLAILVAIVGWNYPFLPRQLTYIGTFTIGVPAFFLSLAPNLQRYKPGFLRRTLLIAVPSGIILALAAMVSYGAMGEGSDSAHTAATITLMVGALALLILLATPLNWMRITLVVAMIIGAAAGLMIPFVRDFFALGLPTSTHWALILGTGVVAAALIVVSYLATAKMREKAS